MLKGAKQKLWNIPSTSTEKGVIENIFGKDGNIVVINVKERFAEKYSKEMIDALEMYRDCNFTYLPDGDIKAIE